MLQNILWYLIQIGNRNSSGHLVQEREKVVAEVNQYAFHLRHTALSLQDDHTAQSISIGLLEGGVFSISARKKISQQIEDLLFIQGVQQSYWHDGDR